MDLAHTLVGYILFVLAGVHAFLDGRANRRQRLLLILSLFLYGTILELGGVRSGGYYYPPEQIINLSVVPLSVSLAWVGIIYSAMMIAERLELVAPLRILAATLIALSLDWGMDPVATKLGIWVWKGTEGAFYGVPSSNMVGWVFVPVCYLLSYGIGWDKAARRMRLLTISEVDEDRTWLRFLYTLLGVTPLSLVLLAACIKGLLMTWPALLNLSYFAMALFAALTVTVASGIVIYRKDFLRRRRWYDIIPGLIMAWISISYTFFAVMTHVFSLVLLMVASALPIWIAFIVGLLPAKTSEPQ